MFSSSLILTLLNFLWRFCLLTWTHFSLPTLISRPVQLGNAMISYWCLTDLCLLQMWLLSKLNPFPAPSQRNWETSSSFSVNKHAVSVLLVSLNTTSCLLTMDITPTCLFLSPSLHFWRQPCSKYFSKTQPCPCWPKPCHRGIVINKTSFSTALTSTTLPCSYPFRTFP